VGLVSFLGLPVRFQDALHGVLAFNTFAPRVFTAEEITFLNSFAHQAAVAIQNARLYEALGRHAASLEERVRERTRELEDARRHAEAASRFKSEFLANMSHELVAPLNAIIGLSEMLLGGEAGRLTEAQVQHVGKISRAGEHLKDLIMDVLDLTKVEWGKLTLRPEPLQVAAVLKDILDISRALAWKKAQELHVDIASALPTVQADPVRFKQICYNLLSNAVKFTPKGGRITLAARLVERPNLEATVPPISSEGPFLEVSVRDTGMGIRAEDLPRLFQAFVQLHAGATERQEGTGVGLALTKLLVELHGGCIWAESAGEGRGSTFTVLLPLGSAPPEPRADER
jgi:signal transduction histidine kinase